MTMLHAQGGPAKEKQEEGRPAQPLLHRGIWTRPSVLLLVKLVYTVTATFDCPLSGIIDHRVLEGKL